MEATTERGVVLLARYNVVGMALDLTGGKFSDEICQISAFYGSVKPFEQYIMTSRSISQNYKVVCGVETSIEGRFRNLRDVKTKKIVSTKSEFQTIKSFLQWLRSTKGTSDGIILAYHDNNKTMTTYITEVLEKFKLTEEFYASVIGFIHISDMSVVCNGKEGSLIKLADYFLNRGQADEKKNAKVRSQLIFQLVEKMFQVESSEVGRNKMFALCSTRAEEMEKIMKKKLRCEKEKSLSVIFKTERKKHTYWKTMRLRRFLLNGGIDYEQLRTTWDNGSETAIKKIILTVATNARDREGLVKIIVDHFKVSNAESTEGHTFELNQEDMTEKMKYPSENDDSVLVDSSGDEYWDAEG